VHFMHIFASAHWIKIHDTNRIHCIIMKIVQSLNCLTWIPINNVS
jgi:hypothetical protein